MLKSTPDVDSELLKTWNLLGPLSIQEIEQKSGWELDYDEYENLEFAKLKYPDGYYEGLVSKGTTEENEIGRQVYSYEIYEGQFEDSNKHGWGREINFSGSYKEGRFKNGFFYEGERYDKYGDIIIDKIRM